MNTANTYIFRYKHLVALHPELIVFGYDLLSGHTSPVHKFKIKIRLNSGIDSVLHFCTKRLFRHDKTIRATKTGSYQFVKQDYYAP